MRVSNRARATRGGYSLIEVLVALAILVIGIIGILQFFPPSLRASSEAALRGRAVLLAQQKAEEIRRDSDGDGFLLDVIADLPQPTDPVAFPEDDRLTYQFYGQSLRDPDGDPSDPEFAPDVPRVIVAYNGEFRPDTQVLYELRFDGGPGIGPSPTPSPTPLPSPTPTPIPLDPPELTTPADNQMFAYADGQTIFFSWTQIPDAAFYVLEVEGVSGAAAGGFPFYQRTLAAPTNFWTLGPPETGNFVTGSYVWRVVAINPPNYSEASSFTYRFFVN